MEQRAGEAEREPLEFRELRLGEHAGVEPSVEPVVVERERAFGAGERATDDELDETGGGGERDARGLQATDSRAAAPLRLRLRVLRVRLRVLCVSSSM